MVSLLKNSDFEVIFNTHQIIFRRIDNSKVIRLDDENEFVLYVETNGTTFPLFPKDFSLSVNQGDVTSLIYSYKGNDDTQSILVEIKYCLNCNILTKNITIKATKDFNILRITSLSGRFNKNVSRGGEGQPIFVDNCLWCGIEFPSANNLILNNNEINCTEAPYFSGKYYECLTVVFGLSNEDVEGSFRRYIFNKSLKKDEIRVYCDWGLHDDMDGGEILTAKLTLDNIDRLADLKESTGVKFDYYLMDAFWFEENDNYLNFKKETFPDGIKPILDKLEENGMKFGLWFDINMIHSHMKNLEKYDTKLGNGSLCFNEKEISNRIRDAFVKHIKENKVKLLKLDFAYFECLNPNHNHSTNLIESKQKSIANFVEIVKEIKEIEPELKIICYNGWTTSLEWIGNVGHHDGFVVSPYWVDVIDYVYCGDPRASEIATNSLAKSTAYYTDAMIRNFVDAMYPLDAIDDHGVMTGNSPTIYFQKNNTFRLGLLMNIMRGSKKMHVYGDVSFYDDYDKRYLTFLEGVYHEIMTNNHITSLILGDPRKGEPYGYINSDGESGYAVAVNPSSFKKCISISPNEWENNEILVTEIIRDGNIIENPKEILSDSSYNVEIEKDGYVLIKWRVKESRNSGLIVTLNPGTNLILDGFHKNQLLLNFFDEKMNPLRTPTGNPDGLFVLEKGKPINPTNKLALWSGISWLCFELNGQSKIIASYQGDKPILMKYLFLGEKVDEL